MGVSEYTVLVGLFPSNFYMNPTRGTVASSVGNTLNKKWQFPLK